MDWCLTPTAPRIDPAPRSHRNSAGCGAQIKFAACGHHPCLRKSVPLRFVQFQSARSRGLSCLFAGSVRPLALPPPTHGYSQHHSSPRTERTYAPAEESFSPRTRTPASPATVVCRSPGGSPDRAARAAASSVRDRTAFGACAAPACRPAAPAAPERYAWHRELVSLVAVHEPLRGAQPAERTDRKLAATVGGL